MSNKREKFNEERFVQENIDIVHQTVTTQMSDNNKEEVILTDVPIPEQDPQKLERIIPEYHAPLRSRFIHVPEAIYKASGIKIAGRRLKSLIFTTDVAIIRNNNAHAVFAVYPFTPEYTIMQSIIDVAPVPCFVGVGGGTTTGERSIRIAFHAEQIGGMGVVVNTPMTKEVITEMNKVLSIPIVVTVTSLEDDYIGKLNAGADMLNVSGGARTAQMVKEIRQNVGPYVPIIATGGPSEESILETIQYGANAIIYTPPSTAEIFAKIMEDYRSKR